MSAREADFSLTSPAPARRDDGRDPHVFAWRDSVTPEDRALVAWLDAQLTSGELDELDAELGEVSRRLNAARDWFVAHDASHPRYRDADVRRRRLEDRQRDLLLQLRTLSYGCWIHVLTTYAALQHVADQAAWIAEHAAGRFTGQTPAGIWHALRGRQPAPGAWPVVDKERWIERRVSALEVWNLEWMRERLAERQTAT